MKMHDLTIFFPAMDGRRDTKQAGVTSLTHFKGCTGCRKAVRKLFYFHRFSTLTDKPFLYQL